MNAIASTLSVIVRIVFNVLGLALALRLLLPLFRMRSDHPLARLVFALTEPILREVRRNVYRPLTWMTPQFYLDMTPLVAFFFLWLIQGVLQFLLGLIITPPLWLFNPISDFGMWLANLFAVVCQAYIYVIFVRVLLELLGTPLTQPLMQALWNLTEPLFSPIRQRIRPIWGSFDFTPLVAILVVTAAQMVGTVLFRLLF